MEQLKPRCQLCFSQPKAELPFYCSTCARNVLYEARIRSAQALVTKETLHNNVLAALTGSFDCESAPDGENRFAKCLATDSQPDKVLKELSLDRTQGIRKQSSSLQQELDDMRAERGRLRIKVSQRRAAHQLARQELAQQESTVKVSLSNAAERAEAKWVAVRSRTSDVRVFLCREVASLYGLVMRKRRKGGQAQDEFLIGQVTIIDLRDLNSADHNQITVSLGRVAHFVSLAAHYLSVRLPAEIIIPSARNPHTLILSPSSSYKDPLPEAEEQNNGKKRAPRLRALCLDRPLPQLASDDRVSYSLFVDAVSLLAWDIAWLARTQGLEIGVAHWEEMCAIGKVLYTLFGPEGREPSQSPHFNQPQNTLVGQASRSYLSGVNTADRDRSGKVHQTQPLESALGPGLLSHDSANAFISASDGVGGGAEHMRTWQFSNPVRFIERIQNALASQRVGAEWELLEENEWVDKT